MAKTFWVETLGCPKNQVDSDKLIGTMLADGMVRGRRPGRRRPRRGQHLRLRRGGPPGVDRHRARARATPGPTAPGWSSPAAWPSATATNWPRPCPRSTPSPASASAPCRSPARRGGRLHRGEAGLAPSPAVPAFDLLNLPRPPVDLAVGLREGGRGLRPGLRLLRDPVVPRPAALADRSSRPARRGRRSSRPARSCSSPRTWPRYGRDQGVGRAPHRAAGRERWPSGSTGSGCSTSTRPISPTSSSTPILATGVPYFDLSLQHVSAPAAAPHASVGRRRHASSSASPTIRAAEPGAAFRSNFIVGLPGRDRGRSRPAAGLRARRPSSTGAGSSPSRPRRAPMPPTSIGRSPGP